VPGGKFTLEVAPVGARGVRAPGSESLRNSACLWRVLRLLRSAHCGDGHCGSRVRSARVPMTFARRHCQWGWLASVRPDDSASAIAAISAAHAWVLYLVPCAAGATLSIARISQCGHYLPLVAPKLFLGGPHTRFRHYQEISRHRKFGSPCGLAGSGGLGRVSISIPKFSCRYLRPCYRDF